MSWLNRLAFFLVCAVVVFTTMAYGTVHQPTIAFFYFLATALVVIWAMDCWVSGELRFSRSVLQVPLFGLAIYGLIQVVPFGSYADPASISYLSKTISIEPFSTQVASLHSFALCFFFTVTLVLLDSAKRLRRMAAFIVIFGFIYGFYAILQSVLSPTKIYGIYGHHYAIPFGSFVNRHDFAALMEMTVAVPLGLLFTGAVRRDKKLLYVVAVTLMTSALLLSGSRGGLVAVIAEIILLVILTTKLKGTKSLLLKTGLSLVLVVAAVGGAIFVGGDTSLTKFAEKAASEDISSSRFHIWDVTLKVIAEHLPFGTGLGAYTQAYTKFDTLSGQDLVEQAHNDYLQIVSDAGIVGLILGVAFLFLFFREGVRNIRSSNTFRRGVATGAFAGCFAILIHSVFDFVLHITAISVMFLTLMAMLIAAGRRFDDDVTEFDEPSLRRRSGSVTPIGKKNRAS